VVIRSHEWFLKKTQGCATMTALSKIPSKCKKLMLLLSVYAVTISENELLIYLYMLCGSSLMNSVHTLCSKKRLL